MPSWSLWALIAFLAWGLWALLPKVVTQHIDPRSAIVYEALGALTVAAVVLASLGFRPAWHGGAVALAFLTGVLGILGGLAYLFAVQRGPVSLIAVLTALYPLVTVALAYVWFGETLSPRQWLGVLLALLAMALILP